MNQIGITQTPRTIADWIDKWICCETTNRKVERPLPVGLLERGSVCRGVCDFCPFEGVLPVGEYAHLNDLAVAERVDSRQRPFAPFRLVFQSDSHIVEHNDLIAGDDEPFWLATSFRPTLTREIGVLSRLRGRNAFRLRETRRVQSTRYPGQMLQPLPEYRSG